MEESSYHDSSSNFTQRKVLAFFLFVFLGIFSIMMCGKTVMLSSSVIEKQFTSYSAVTALRQDITDYVADEYCKDGLDSDNLESVITYDYVKEIASAFASSNFNSQAGFSQSTVDDAVDTLAAAVKSETESQAESAGYKKTDDAVSSLTEGLKTYIDTRLTFPGSTKLESILNICSIVLTVTLVVSVILVLAFAAMIYFTGKRRYRSLRSISMAFAATGVTELLVCIMAAITFAFKTVDIYPLFMQYAFNGYINTSIRAMAFCGGCMLLVATTFAAVSWKIKKTVR